MPSLLKVILLAIVQGVTEFLPISSSGHLVLAKHAMGLETKGIFLEVALHAGTLVSILVYYRKRLGLLIGQFLGGTGEGRYYALLILVATIPAGALYIAADDYIENMFSSPVVVGSMLCVTGIILLSLLARRGNVHDVSLSRSIIVGIVQSFALIPGISRSGITITVGRHLGLSPERAAEFSFFIAIPALAGALLIKAIDLVGSELGDVTVTSLAIGAAVSGVVGYLALLCLIRVLKAGKFWLFGVYCLVVGVISLMTGL